MNVYVLNATETGFLANKLIADQIEIKGVITLSPEAGSKVNEYYDYGPFCKERGIECLYLNDYSLKEDGIVSLLSERNIDVLLVLSWQRLLPQSVIDCCSVGAIGIHGSPWGITEGRGRSPQNWALLMGLNKFSISIFWIDPYADSGEVISTKEFTYDDTDTIETSYIKCAYATSDMIINLLKNDKIVREGTMQEGEAYYLPKRTKNDGEIDWNRNGKDIYNFIRALTKPYPGAFSLYKNSIIHIWRATFIDGFNPYENNSNGEIVFIFSNNKLLIKCKDGTMLVDEYDIEGSDKLEINDVLKSASIIDQIKQIVDNHYLSGGKKVNPFIENIQ